MGKDGSAFLLAEVFLKTVSMVCITVIAVVLILGLFGGLG